MKEKENEKKVPLCNKMSHPEAYTCGIEMAIVSYGSKGIFIIEKETWLDQKEFCQPVQLNCFKTSDFLRSIQVNEHIKIVWNEGELCTF